MPNLENICVGTEDIKTSLDFKAECNFRVLDFDQFTEGRVRRRTLIPKRLLEL